MKEVKAIEKKVGKDILHAHRRITFTENRTESRFKNMRRENKDFRKKIAHDFRHVHRRINS